MTHRLTRLLTILACAGVLSLFTAAASPALCPTTTTGLDTYLVSGFSCQIGDKIFSNFNYQASGTNPFSSANVTVNTLGPTGTLGAQQQSNLFPNDIGLKFGGAWVASGNNTSSDALIGFEVAVVNGAGMAITDAGLAQAGGFSGTGSASVVENGCSGAVNPCTQQWGILTLQQAGSSVFSSDTIISPTGIVSVQKDILVNAGSNGFATISGVTDVFSQSPVPEPRTISMLLGLGLVAGLTLKKKLQGARG